MLFKMCRISYLVDVMLTVMCSFKHAAMATWVCFKVIILELENKGIHYMI